MRCVLLIVLIALLVLAGGCTTGAEMARRYPGGAADQAIRAAMEGRESDAGWDYISPTYPRDVRVIDDH